MRNSKLKNLGSLSDLSFLGFDWRGEEARADFEILP